MQIYWYHQSPNLFLSIPFSPSPSVKTRHILLQFAGAVPSGWFVIVILTVPPASQSSLSRPRPPNVHQGFLPVVGVQTSKVIQMTPDSLVRPKEVAQKQIVLEDVNSWWLLTSTYPNHWPLVPSTCTICMLAYWGFSVEGGARLAESKAGQCSHPHTWRGQHWVQSSSNRRGSSWLPWSVLFLNCIYLYL